MAEKIPIALTVAGSDPCGGAGIQADLKTFAALGTYGLSVLTSLTAQNTTGVRAVHDLPEEFVGLQLDAVMDDIGCDAAKVGMLSNEKTVRTVARGIDRHGIEKLVVDPVMRSKDGTSLLKNCVGTLAKEILPKALIVTPNIPEAEILGSLKIESVSDMKTAAERIFSLGAGAVLVKGGHLPKTHPATDVFFDGEKFRELAAERVETENTHGTGCTLSAAVCAFLAKGMPLEDSVRNSKTFITNAVRNSLEMGKGRGPLDHFQKT